MKRISIAEQTLAKQIKELDETIRTLYYQRDRLDAQIEVLDTHRSDMAIEQRSLQEARMEASIRNKP